MIERLSKKISNPWSILLIFIGIGVSLYGNALDNGFYYDDIHQIVENPFTRSLSSIPQFFIDLTTTTRNPVWKGYHYRPLLLSTFSLNYWLGGLNPIGYHLVNLAFQVGSSFLVFLIVRRFWGSFSPALAAGLVMLCNPFNAEVVNYITARSSVMATFFYLLSFFAYIRFRPPWPEGRVGDKAPGNLWIWVSLGSFSLGLLTKEIVITLPLILLLYEWTFVPKTDHSWKTLIRQVAPFFILFLGYLLIRKLVSGMMGSPVGIRDLQTHVWVQFKALAATWQLILFPVNLSVIHDVPAPQSLLEWKLMGSILLFIGLLGIIVWVLRSDHRKSRMIGFSIAWFYITLLPTTLIPLVLVLQENRGYIAGISFAFIVGVLVFHLESRREGRLKQVAWGGIGIIILAYGIGVIVRNQVWESEVNLWQDAVHKAPLFDETHNSLGIAYQHMGWYEAAADEMRRAVELNPSRPDLHSNLGGVSMYLGKEDLAEKEYRESIRLDPYFDRAHTNLGILLRRRGDWEAAKQELETAFRIYPFSDLTLYNLSRVYQQEGRPDKALKLLTDALEKNPNLPKIQWQLGLLYKEQGDNAAAREAFERALRIDPTLGDVPENVR
jgi:Tfp pilus assembly protein PilF